jgi:hypothetical protein
MTRSPRSHLRRFVTLCALAGFGLSACAESLVPDSGLGSDSEWMEAYGVNEPIEMGSPAGKEDTTGGPSVAWERTDTVWTIRNQWGQVTPEAGIAWPANSGLTWEQKYEAWVQSLPTVPRVAGGTTFELVTPYGVRLPAPYLECAEVAIFLRVTFASWYGLPFYLRASSNGSPIYLGHFGFRKSDGTRFSGTPNFASAYRDHTATWQEGQAWPTDAALQGRGLYGGGDEVPFLPEVNGQPARAGAYFDAFFLNKRVGHFMLLALSWFGSMNLADESNMMHIQPEATRAGDVLVHRWQRSGIGHTLPVMRVSRPMENRLDVALASGSMPRRQPVWEQGANVIWNFTSENAGGPGTNSDGVRYATLGGGIRRWLVPVSNGTIYTNTVGASASVRIRASAVDTIAARPQRFRELLASVSPQEMRDAAVGRIEAARAHLSNYPASCSARERREQGFDTLYEVMAEHFGMPKAEVDARYRVLADYVFAELEYTRSRSCCWNSTTNAMYQIVMAYADAEQQAAFNRGECLAPTVFMGRNRGAQGDGYQIYRAYAESLGRGGEWVAWRADEACPQSTVVTDTERPHAWTPFCDLPGVADPGDPVSCNDGNDERATATRLSEGTVRGTICQNDRDIYRIDLAARRAVDLTLSFRHSVGDLDMVLVDASGNRVALSQGSTDTERITPTLAAGTYYLEIYGWNGATGDYTLTYAAAAISEQACGDAGSAFGSAVTIDGSRSGLRICSGEADWWKFTPIADGRLRIQIDFQHSRGDLDLAVYRTASERIGLSQGTDDRETIEIDVRRGQAIVIHVYGYGGAIGDYNLVIREI